MQKYLSNATWFNSFCNVFLGDYTYDTYLPMCNDYNEFDIDPCVNVS